MRSVVSAGALMVVAACGNGADRPIDASRPDAAAADAGGPDAVPDAGVPLGIVHELPLLPGNNHSAETTVAALGDDVVVTAINLTCDAADTFDGCGVSPRKSAVWVSHDGGQTFGPPSDLGIAGQSSDPVLVSGADGSFWFSSLTDNGINWTLARSQDGGASWALVVQGYPIGDKPWIAIDDAGGTVFAASANGFDRVAFDGTPMSFAPPLAAMGNNHGVAGYVDSAGAHFLNGDGFTVLWDGTTMPVYEGAQVDHGPAANIWTNQVGSLGPLAPAGQWLVTNWRDDTLAIVQLRLTDGGGAPLAISDPQGVAFLPAAAVDSAGFLHVVWYETTGPSGQLVYSRSTTAPAWTAFTAPVVVDPEAGPGDRWYPYPSNELPPGGRRFREYIGIAVTDTRVHVAWTHSPTAPARVWVTSFDR